ncbi:hypothetical protein F4818DRAFT_7785 [Hypoxylon cercidicola]|nr:hypothetical protein F4818DRAFT_7785 [Hypoxylon cercidicola]
MISLAKSKMEEISLLWFLLFLSSSKSVIISGFRAYACTSHPLTEIDGTFLNPVKKGPDLSHGPTSVTTTEPFCLSHDFILNRYCLPSA